MDFPSNAKILGIILTLTFLDTVVQLHTYETGTGPTLPLHVYQNITSTCPEKELCKNREDFEFMAEYLGCQCDELCSVYEDCCRDSPYFVPSDIPKVNLSCVEVTFALSQTKTKLRMVTTCPIDASPEEHQLCGTLNEAMYLLSLVPITVTEENITVIYRNVYCARCNIRGNPPYELWNTTLACDSDRRRGRPIPVDVEANWDPGKKRWVYVDGNMTAQCDMRMLRPNNLHWILPHVKCQTPLYDQCPEGTDPQMSQLCKSYTALVRNRRGYMFKNQHCFTCNGGGSGKIYCGFKVVVYPRSGSVFLTGDISHYSVLLRHVRSECGPGEHYDGILKDCVQLFPPRVARLENASPIDICARAKLSPRFYELSSDNSTVKVPKYEQNFTQGQFRLTESGELEICEKDVPPLPPTAFSVAMAILTLVGFCLSILFLLLHLCAVLLVAELRNLSGITLASLCLALLGGYVSFIAGIFLKDEPYLWCYACAIVTYYFFMASFFWMLVLAYDVSKVLRASVKKFRSSHGFHRMRFTIYSVIAWGTPIIACVVIHWVDYSQSSGDAWFRPMFGLHGCWFGSPESHIVFFVAPLAVIMLLNFSFFVYAAWMTSDNSTGQRRHLRVYVKLTILLGLNWIVGLLARVLDSDCLWVIFSVLNTLQGLFIFLSFTMTSKVSKGLSKIFPCLDKSAKKANPQNTSEKETSFISKVTTQDSNKK